jgi:hypothetical protein
VTKYLRNNKIKGEKVYFGSQFQWFQSMVSWLHVPEGRQNIAVMEARARERLLIL